MSTKFASSSREDIKNKTNKNNNKKFSFKNGQIINNKKKKKNPKEVKKTGIEELKNDEHEQNEVNVYVKKSNNKICLICEENLKPSEVRRNKLKCKHFICNDCYYQYLKEKINNNQFLDIKCPKKECEEILGSNMIVQILFNDTSLLNK